MQIKFSGGEISLASFNDSSTVPVRKRFSLLKLSGTNFDISSADIARELSGLVRINFWAFGKRLELADDYTHVSKLSSFKLRSVLKKKFNLVDVYSRNIFLDSRLRFLKGNFFKRKLGLLVGQKTIVVGTKKERS